MQAKEIMTPQVITVSPATPVAEIAHLLREKHISGVPVVNEAGKVVGIVTEIDLIKRHARIHFPVYLPFLESLVFLESSRHYQEEVRRALGTKVTLSRSKKGGTIMIHFYSEEELDAIYRRIIS